MSNRDWASTLEFEDLIIKAEANGASEWILSSQRRTEVFLVEKARQRGKHISYFILSHPIRLFLCFLFFYEQFLDATGRGGRTGND